MADKSIIDRIGFDVMLDLAMNVVFHKLFVAKKDQHAEAKGGDKKEKDEPSILTQADEATLLAELRQIIADYKGGALAVGKKVKEEQDFVLKAWDQFTTYCLVTKKRPEILVAVRKILKAENDPEERRQTFGFLFGLLVKSKETDDAKRFDPVINLIDSVTIGEMAQAKLNFQSWVADNKKNIEVAFRNFVNPAWLKRRVAEWQKFIADLEARADQLVGERHEAHGEDNRPRSERVAELAATAGDLITGRPKKWRFSLIGTIIVIIAVIVISLVIIPIVWPKGF